MAACSWREESSVPPRTAEVREIPGRFGDCERLSEQITAVAGRYGFETDEMVAIALAVDEALRNAISHGNRSDRSKSVRVEYMVDDSQVRVTVTDQGSGFDLDMVPGSLSLQDAEKRGGRGIFLMGQFMSGIRFVPPGNRVEIWRHRGEQKWPHVRIRRARGAPPRVLLAEDDAEMRTLLESALRKADFEVTACGDGWSLLRLLGSCLLFAEHDPAARIDLVVSDIQMPFLSGLKVLELARKAEGIPPVILITAFGSTDIHASAGRLGAAAVLDKPFDIDELLATARGLAPPRGR
jgi:anti-sigma regulatory factor (Ser/Thr protein kinase)/ActR/RegA family two-component response regulator